MATYFIKKSLLTDPKTWTTGSGSSSGYGQNGNTGENERVVGTDPWGNSAIVWETRASGDGGADGGWNADTISIDRSKLYRFSVWVKRTSSTGSGTFYFGTAGGSECPNALGTSSQMCNPYWHCANTGTLTQNQWYLTVGHVFPSTYTSTNPHPDTGLWTVSNNSIYSLTKAQNINQCNISGGDLKWGASSDSTYHRTYHYYCGDSTTRLQFFDPRLEICDGTQPTIQALLLNQTNKLDSRTVTLEGNSFKHQRVIATGGNVITEVGEWRIHRFTSSGTFTVTGYKGDSLTVDYLIVAGGGGGGMDMGGGGGGGAVLNGTMVLGTGAYTITVGAGGTGAPAAGTNGQNTSHQYNISATAGGNSSAFGFTANGGGYGGSSYFGYTPNYGYGGNGGNGGGASGYSDGNTGRAGSGNQGYNGGSNGGQYYSGGGGGAGAVGASGTARANGGVGKLVNILGKPFYWGGGGGGAAYSLGTGGDGGLGGGGGGALGVTSGGGQALTWGNSGQNGACCSWANVPGGDGGTNSGGGGGGGSHYNSNNKGGNGGSGIVVVRYKFK
jgi:hypothetical protein